MAKASIVFEDADDGENVSIRFECDTPIDLSNPPAMTTAQALALAEMGNIMEQNKVIEDSLEVE